MTVNVPSESWTRLWSSIINVNTTNIVARLKQPCHWDIVGWSGWGLEYLYSSRRSGAALRTGVNHPSRLLGVQSLCSLQARSLGSVQSFLLSSASICPILSYHPEWRLRVWLSAWQVSQESSLLTSIVSSIFSLVGTLDRTMGSVCSDWMLQKHAYLARGRLWELGPNYNRAASQNEISTLRKVSWSRSKTASKMLNIFQTSSRIAP